MPRRWPVVALLAAACSPAAWAGCDTVAPLAGQAVTCSATAPNPQTVPIVASGQAGVVVTVQAGALLVQGTATSAISLLGAGGHVLDNAGSIRTSGGSAVQLGAGSRVVNDGSVDAGTGTAIRFVGVGNSVLVNRGTLVGSIGVQSDSGNDQLEMLAGSLSGAVLQGAGDDSLVVVDGSVGSVDQGDGRDSLRVDGGAITGIVQQGNGVDSVTLQGGTVGALLQGDNIDTFVMTGGRIIGAFEDGDIARMSGGRIGRVNMKLDNNVFDMSGGTIDGNLVTGFGNDRIVLTDGYIGGNISVSGGTDSVAISGGTVRGEIRLSLGNDRLDWDGGGVVHGVIDLGEGDDAARLANLNQAHLGAMPTLDGGTGVDALVMDNIKTSGVGRVAGWEQIALANDTELGVDGRLVLGDAGTGTGTLDIDATSALFVSGAGNGIAAFLPDARATVSNAGRIDMHNGSAGDQLTVQGSYAGTGAALYLDAVLAADDAASDRLVISGGTATGTTGIGVFNVGGTGAATVLDGILAVQAINGATTAPGAFALHAPVSAGAYEYFLFRSGVTAGTEHNWYLRSTLVTAAQPVAARAPRSARLAAPPPPPAQDPAPPPDPLPDAPPPPLDVPPDPAAPDPAPLAAEPAPPVPPPEPPAAAPPVLDTPPPVPDTPAILPAPLVAPPTPGARPAQGDIVPIYRVETPTYAVVPSLLRTLSQASLGTFHARQGEQRLLVAQSGLRSAWGRLITRSEEQHWAGDAQTGFDGDVQGLQSGVEVYAYERAAHHAQLGVFVGRTRATGAVSGMALAWEGVQVGQLRVDDQHLGLSWTAVGTAGGYLDAVLLRSRYRGDAWSTRGQGIPVRGNGTTASLELGRPLQRGESAGWWLEPQVQVIWQRQSLDATADSVAAIGFGGDDSWTGRVGLRAAVDHGRAGNAWQAYLTLDYWRTLSGRDWAAFDGDRIRAGQQTSALRVGAGVVGNFNHAMSAYAAADYTHDLEDHARERRSLAATVGLRLAW